MLSQPEEHSINNRIVSPAKILIVLVVLIVVCAGLLTILWELHPTPSGPVAAACAQGSPVNVRNFGATGDGKTDDTKAVQSAMNCVATLLTNDSTHTATLYFPPGTYRISNVVTLSQNNPSWKNVTIEGENFLAPVIETSGMQGIFDLQFDSQVPTTIENLMLVADMAHAGAAVALSMPPDASSPSSLTMQDVSILGLENGVHYFDYGVRGSGLTKPLFEGVKITGPAMPSLGGQYTYGTACISLAGGWGVAIASPSMCNEMAAGLQVTQNGGAVSVTARSFGVGSDYGIDIEDAGGGTVDIENMHVNTSVWGISIDHADSVTLANDLTLDGGTASGEHGDFFIENSSNISIDDNVLWSQPNPNRTYIEMGSGDSNVKISNNIISNGDGDTGISIAPGIVGAHITNNLVYSTPDIVDNGIDTSIVRLPPQATLP